MKGSSYAEEIERMVMKQNLKMKRQKLVLMQRVVWKIIFMNCKLVNDEKLKDKFEETTQCITKTY